jgi:integrase
MKEVLTDRRLLALKPAPAGKRVMIWDAAVPSFGVRITDKGSASFIIMRRLDGVLIRRQIGIAWHVPLKGVKELPYALAEARQEAREAILNITRGVDPKQKKAAASRERHQQRKNTFTCAAEAFISHHVKNLRSAANVTSIIRNKLIQAWADRPISEISRSDVIKLVRDSMAEPYAARQLLTYAKQIFAWAKHQDCFGLKASPCSDVSWKQFSTKLAARQRVLSDSELREIWHATTRTNEIGYPFAPLVQFLLLTGARLREAGEMTWREIDLEKGIWSLPAERMKSKAAHEAPLSSTAIELLKTLPRWPGPFVFSTTGGRKPVAGFSSVKRRLDSMLKDVEPWVFHDLRRTMRTHLGGLPVPNNVAELVLAHAQPGMHKVYDLHSYRDEKRRALELWASRLMSIVEPVAAANVITLAARA